MTIPDDITEASVELPSGVKLHYAETGGRLSAALILLHGYTDSWRSFRLVLPLLSNTCRVIALDQRGHGDSSAPLGDYSIARMAQDVEEFMDQLGLRTASLLGHSMGSFVARRVTLDSPHRVDRLIVVDSALKADNDVLRSLRDEVYRFADWIPENFADEFQASCIYRRELVPEWFFRSAVAASRRTPLHVWRAAIDGLLAEDHEAQLSTITCPSLIIGGRHDTVFTVWEQEELARTLGRALRLYRHSGHTPQWEEPGRFAEDIHDFLAQPADPEPDE